jgi:hypothetical protein
LAQHQRVYFVSKKQIIALCFQIKRTQIIVIVKTATVNRSYGQPRPRVVEDTIQRREIQIEKKTFVLALKENPRGCFLRITEFREPQSAAIIIPLPGLKDFQKLLADMVAAANNIQPTKTSPPA